MRQEHEVDDCHHINRIVEFCTIGGNLAHDDDSNNEPSNAKEYFCDSDFDQIRETQNSDEAQQEAGDQVGDSTIQKPLAQIK